MVAKAALVERNLLGWHNTCDHRWNGAIARTALSTSTNNYGTISEKHTCRRGIIPLGWVVPSISMYLMTSKLAHHHFTHTFHINFMHPTPKLARSSRCQAIIALSNATLEMCTCTIRHTPYYHEATAPTCLLRHHTCYYFMGRWVGLSSHMTSCALVDVATILLSFVLQAPWPATPYPLAPPPTPSMGCPYHMKS